MMEERQKSARRRKKNSNPEFELVDAGSEFLNRDIGWLEFNARVLNESLDARTPLLERLRFLGIFTSNLDEFFMKRVGALKRHVELGVMNSVQSTVQPKAQLAEIRQKIKPLLDRQAQCYGQEIRPLLKQHGITLVPWEELSVEEITIAKDYFYRSVFPVLTPLAVDPGHPFPFISNLSVSLAISLRHPARDERLFARVKVPKIFPQWHQLSTSDPQKGNYRFVSLMDLIRHNLDLLFPNMELLSVMPFRVTRNAYINRDEEDAEDILEMVEEEVRERRFGEVIRLEYGPNGDPNLLNFLQAELDLADDDLYEIKEELDYTSLRPIFELNLPSLCFESWVPAVPIALLDDQLNIFSILRGKDMLVHHPFESFVASVERFIKTAVEDPKVLAIKMTLYRIGDNSPFIPYLIRAAEAGKQVVCLIELKARFDEERNIHWAQALEDAGVHVVYGIVGLKTHAKVALVVRQEPEGLRSYCHLGSGNYHVETAKLYTDLGLMTSNKDVTDDVVEFFHYLTGRSLKKEYRKLLVAPINMRDRFVQLIQREMEHKKAGRPARIVAKMNNLEDRTLITQMYEASKAGVMIDLFVRGFSTLRPGVAGLSENIRVTSVIGRFLEHSRIFFFQNGQEDPVQGEFFMGSADWMNRNLSGRVEAIVPIEAQELREKTWEILTVLLEDRRQSWILQSDGSYVQNQPADPKQEISAQQRLMQLTRIRVGATNA